MWNIFCWGEALGLLSCQYFILLQEHEDDLTDWGIELELEQNICGRGRYLFGTADSGFLGVLLLLGLLVLCCYKCRSRGFCKSSHRKSGIYCRTIRLKEARNGDGMFQCDHDVVCLRLQNGILLEGEPPLYTGRLNRFIRTHTQAYWPNSRSSSPVVAKEASSK